MRQRARGGVVENMSERIYVRVYEKGKKRPSLEFQAEDPGEVIREFCLWLARRHPKAFKNY